MRCCESALELTTAVNSLAAVLLIQLGDTLGTIAVRRSILKNCTGKA